MKSAYIHSGGIGDFLVSCPALSAWRPAGELFLIGQKERLEIAVAAGLADAALDLDAVEFSSLFSEPSPRCRTFFQELYEVIVWMRDDDNKIGNRLAECGVKQVRCFSGLPDAHWTKHASDYYAQCLGVEIDPRFRLRLPPVPQQYDVLIHPGSGGTAKNWPLENFVALTRSLQKRNRDVHWVLGPAEHTLEVPTGIPLLEIRNLLHLGQCLQNATQYIGNDSGISHLAGLLNTPTLAIFGATNPQIWHPLGENCRVISGIPWPTVEEVLNFLGI